MGTLARVGLSELARRHRLDTLVETGTGHGHSLLAALQVPALIDIRSIEVDYETWHRARVVFATEPRVRVYLGDSPEVLDRICAELEPLRRTVLWFLDAHYPGSGRLDPLPMIAADPSAAVPLLAEFRAIFKGRDIERDVFVVDDLCLFEPGNYESDAPELRAALGFDSLGWLEDGLAATHNVARVLRDGGYLIAEPKAGP